VRIVFITNNYTPYSGGVVSSINATVDALHKAGHEVFIVTLDFLGKAHNDPPYVLRIPSLIQFTYKKNHLAIPWRPYHQMMRIIKDLKPDILHTHHPFYLGTAALKIAQELSLPIVFTYHSIYEGYLHYVPLPKWITQTFVTKKVLTFCHAMHGIIAPSKSIQQYLQSHGIQTPTVVIPSGLQELFIQEPFVLSSSKHKRPDSSTGSGRTGARVFQLLYVGRFTQEKNIPFILDVMRLLYPVRADPPTPKATSDSGLPCPPKLFSEGRVEALNGAYPSTSSGRTARFHLKLVGYGVEYDNLRTYAYHTLKLPESVVQFIHKPTKQELLKQYRQADLFVFPSFLDTQGLVLAEAMACGVPVIAVHGPGQQDIVRNGYNGFLIEDRDNMAKKILDISSDKQQHNTLQQGAFETSKNYNPQVVTENLINFYEKINTEDARPTC